MALLWTATVAVRDAKGKTATEKFFINSADLTAITDANDDPVEYFQELMRAQDALMKGQIVKMRLSVNVAIPDEVKTAPLADSDVEEGAIYSMRTDNNSPVILRVPTFDEAFILPDGQVDDSEADVIYFNELLTIPEETVGDFSIGVTDNRGDDVFSIESAHENFLRREND